MGRGTKVCSRDLGHMIKMVTTIIYGKTPLKSSPGPVDRFQRNLPCCFSIGNSSPSFYSSGDRDMTLTYFTAMSNLERWTFLWEKAKTMNIL